jgi:DNA/RNA-binding domain of Phe-tRNA-synthetase-like protein
VPATCQTAVEVFDVLRLDAPTPGLTSDDAVRAAVRELLRHEGDKPAGRVKPASEYLLRAVGENALSSISVVSLHAGLPISVVDLALVKPPLRVGLAPEGTTHVFNASGQTSSTPTGPAPTR